MYNIMVHRIDVTNIKQFVPEIVHIYRDDEVVPWHKHDECLEWISCRVERGFYITVACDGDTVVGHSEWIETYDKGKKLLYLGVMQVDCDLRSRGIGKTMIDDAEKYAQSIGATHLRTIPEEERSLNFYCKNGFVQTDTIYLYICPTESQQAAIGNEIPPVTLATINNTPFISGLAQSSGRHMYECANHHPKSTGYTAKTYKLPDGYLQLRYESGKKTAEALYWSNTALTKETITIILSIGHEAGFEDVQFNVRSKYSDLFTGRSLIVREGWEYEFIELEKNIKNRIDTSQIIIETERLILRAFTEADLSDFFAYASVPGVGEMAGWPHHQSIETSKDILRSFIDEKEVFAVFHKAEGKVIGSLGVHEPPSWLGKDGRFKHLNAYKIGYVLAKDFWGHGLMPEAVKAVINYGFNTLGINAFTCEHFTENSQSRRVIEKIGFEFVMKGEYYAKLLDKTFEEMRYILIHNTKRPEPLGITHHSLDVFRKVAK